MRKLLVLPAMLVVECARPSPQGPLPSLPITVNSHNRSEIEVYLLCGDRDAELVGVIPGQENRLFEVPASRARCALGLNFFLVSRSQNQGYWVGPLRPVAGQTVALTIEKYAGSSTADVHYR